MAKNFCLLPKIYVQAMQLYEPVFHRHPNLNRGFVPPQLLFHFFLSGELLDWIFHYLTVHLQPHSECFLAFSASVWAEWKRLAPTRGWPGHQELPKVQIWQPQLQAAPRTLSLTHINNGTGLHKPNFTLKFECFVLLLSLKKNSTYKAAVLPD